MDKPHLGRDQRYIYVYFYLREMLNGPIKIYLNQPECVRSGKIDFEIKGVVTFAKCDTYSVDAELLQVFSQLTIMYDCSVARLLRKEIICRYS